MDDNQSNAVDNERPLSEVRKAFLEWKESYINTGFPSLDEQRRTYGDIAWQGFEAGWKSACENRTVLLGVIELVRHHPDFDNGGPMADAMDEALRGETPKLLTDIAHLRHGIKPPEATFTTHDLAREMLRQFRRDIPNTMVGALTIVLERFVKTGEYIDDMGILLGKQPVPPLGVQRFDEEALNAKLQWPEIR